MSQTANLLITEIAANQNQKEVTANTAFENLDGAIAGLFTKTLSDADYTLTTGESGEALSHMAFTFNGTLTNDRNIVVPTNKKLYVVQNNTTGGHNLTVKTSAGTGVSVSPSSTQYVVVYCDGTNVLAASTIGNVTHTGTLTANHLVLGNGTADLTTLSSLGSTSTLLHGNAGGAPSFSAVVEGDISLSNVTTNDVSTTKHGFTPRLPNDATRFLDGTGAWSTPSGGGGGGGGGSRTTVSKTTGSLADGATETGTVNLAKSFMLLRVETDVAARVRIYCTAAHRDDDLARSVSTDPTGMSGLIAEIVTAGPNLVFDLAPMVVGANLEATPSTAIAYSITNNAGTTGTVTVTFTVLGLE